LEQFKYFGATLRLCPACQRPACTHVSRPLTWVDKHIYANGAVLRCSA